MMAKDVYETLRQIVAECSGRTPEQAKSFLTSLQTSNHYLQDIWQ
jgi:sulfite reductase alpha subunit-like flavoprotein